MNFYTVLPNGYASIFAQPPVALSQPKPNNSLILNALSFALKKSIWKYTTAFQQQEKRKLSCISQSKAKEPEKTTQIIDCKKKKDQPSNIQIQQKVDSKNISLKVNVQPETTIKPKQNCILNTVIDQPTPQAKLTQAPVKESTSNKMPKNNNRNKRQSKAANFPTVSLIEAANLPIAAFTCQQLKKKKQSLLRRQVSEWTQKNQNRRDKREIRMLNC